MLLSQVLVLTRPNASVTVCSKPSDQVLVVTLPSASLMVNRSLVVPSAKESTSCSGSSASCLCFQEVEGRVILVGRERAVGIRNLRQVFIGVVAVRRDPPPALTLPSWSM